MKGCIAAALALTLGFGSVATAQTAPDSKWPEHPLRFIVPLPAGSAVDVMARLIGKHLGERLGQPLIIENRAGASGVLGSDITAKSDPDGYTLGMATSTTHITAPVLNRRMPYDAMKDFAFVATVGRSPYVMVVKKDLPVKTVADVIKLAKEKPGTISYSSVGDASQARLVGELFSERTGIKLNHIPYKTSTQAVIDLNAGRIDMQFGIIGSSLPMIREGTLRALATTTPTRAKDLPDVPTMAEAGVPDMEAALLFALVMPAKTPKAIVDLINRHVVEIMAMPDVKQMLARQAIEATSNSPQQSQDQFGAEIKLWSDLATKAGLRS